MAEKRMERRLAAIVVADVVGYSKMMGSDEAGTLARLRERRETILNPVIDEHHGRIVKLMGDGFLLEFTSAVNAAAAAIALQQRMQEANAGLPDARRIVLRIGINLGDIVVDDGDLYGDGVNIAARLESVAEPGAIYVSSGIRDQVHRKLAFEFDDLGLKSLKNIAEPVHVYRLRTEANDAPEDAAPDPAPPQPSAPLPLPAKPSIAVLPFTNLGGDPEQEVFTDGLTEDLITDLSRNAGLFVIARHSTFAYKGRSVDVRAIARDLGVRYILEGSARRAASRIRINVQLVDALGGDHIWAERFDRSVEDIFGVQDEVASKIVEALVGRLKTLPARAHPKSLEAYDLLIRARALISAFTSASEAIREARMLLTQAIAIDPDYAEAFRWLSFVYWQFWAHNIEADPDENRAKALELARKSVALDRSDAGNRWLLGYLLAYEKRWTESDDEFAAAFALDPNQADALCAWSELKALAGQAAEAIDLAEKGLRLNPQPPGFYYWQLGLAYYAARQYEAAVKTLRLDITYRSGSRRILAASLAQLGRTEDARHEAALFMAATPHFRIAQWAEAQPARDPATIAHFVEGYRLAGLPD